MDYFKIAVLITSFFQVIMTFGAIPLVSFLLSNQRNIVNLDNRVGTLEKTQVTSKERLEDSTKLVKIETLLEQGDKRMHNIELTLRTLIGERLHPKINGE